MFFALSLALALTTPHVPSTPQPITIWVHGTKASSFLPIQVTQRIEDKLDELSRLPIGLHHLQSINPQSRIFQLNKFLADTDSYQFPFDGMYGFGWSGELSPEARTQAAEILYESLAALHTAYESKHATVPEINIITHSHGGNVALHISDFVKLDNALAINRLILLACPVQAYTKQAIEHTMFKNIYAIHSHWDMVQVGDPQRLHPVKKGLENFFRKGSWKDLIEAFKQTIHLPQFSERHFKSAKPIKHIDVVWHTTIPWDDTDLEMFGEFGLFIKQSSDYFKAHKRGVLHEEFIIPSFIKKLPSILSYADNAPYVHGADIKVRL